MNKLFLHFRIGRSADPRFYEPLYNELFVITNSFKGPDFIKYVVNSLFMTN